MQFEVEAVVSASVVVFARQLSPGTFLLGARPMLGGVPIRPEVVVPRALDAAGNPRHDLFVFRPESAADLPKFVVGEKVALEQGYAG